MKTASSIASRLMFALLLTAAAMNGSAKELAPVRPEEVGLSSERLNAISDALREKVADAEFPGAVLLIARHGRIAYLKGFGALAPDQSTPMPPDAIFRLYSMSKPITSAAIMALVEDGRISLDDPVSKYLPQLGNRQVVVSSEPSTTPEYDRLATEPAADPITIQDLLRHSSGLVYGFPYRTPVQKLYAHARLWDDQQSNADFVDRLAKLPLSHSPGTTWEYGYSTDVLGRVIEVVSGKTLWQFEQERILGPLGMADTGFYVADRTKQARIAEAFPADRQFGKGDGTIAFFDPRVPKTWQSGGAGMVSTVTDYARFLQMLLDGGSLDGHRILSPNTVGYMTADHLDSAIASPFPGYGWSLAFAVRRETGVSSMPGSVGDYFWYSAGGGSFWVDPKEDLFAIFMAYKPANMEHYQTLMRQMVYAAIIR